MLNVYDVNILALSIMENRQDDKVIRGLIKNIVERTKVLAKRTKVDLRTDLDDLEKEVLKKMDKMINGGEEAPDDDITIVNVKKILVRRKRRNESRQTVFSDEYFRMLEAFVKMLESHKKTRRWLNIREIMMPFLTIEFEDKEQ